MKASSSRPSWAQIDLENISYNLEQMKAHLPVRQQVFAVVKADAYGHGALAVAKQLASQVNGFCVATFDEALELRQAGIESRILVLGVIPIDQVEQAGQLSISITVTSLEWLQLALAGQVSFDQVAVHIKIDSGMGRLGFRQPAEMLEALEILDQAGAYFEGIYTHFASADEQDDRRFHGQLARFQEFLDQLETLPALVHASNSAASLWQDQALFNMVRLGDVLYGLNPSGRALELPFSIRPALSLYSEIVHVKCLEAGETVGYGHTYTSQVEEIIATVPIGYADGLRRSLQGFHVLVDGQICPIVGRVSMDQITIKLPRVYPLGTRVTLIGQDQEATISVQDWADYLGTINYEITCMLSDRLPRKID
ncbi:TPA: alanine racemase [Streptococcus suis]|nr:alanine racemase [Streptococcus suis]